MKSIQEVHFDRVLQASNDSPMSSLTTLLEENHEQHVVHSGSQTRQSN